MKHFKLVLFVSVVSLLSFSCSTDDDGGNNTSGDIAGTWEMTAFSVDNGETTVSAGGQTVTSQFTQVGTAFDYTITFSENPNEVSAAGSYTVDLVTIFQGQSIEQTETLFGDVSDGTWSVNGNVLTSTDADGNTSTAEIVELTANTLRFDIDLSQANDQLPDGASVSGNAVYTLER